MAGIRGVISTLTQDGQELMGPHVLLFHYPDNSIVSGTLLTVESNHYCVLKSRGAILQVYETGQYPVQTPDKVLFGSVVQAFYGGTSPWQYEAIYVNKAKLIVKSKGMALSREMAEMAYDVDYYVHVNSVDDAVALVQHMPVGGHTVTVSDVDNYASPVISQAINQIVQVTPLEKVNERIHEVSQVVGEHLQKFLIGYGIRLDTVKVMLRPSDERMRSLISLKAFGLTELEAVRYYTAMHMADRGLISAPNVAIGAPFFIGGMPTMNVPTGGHSLPAEQPRPVAAAAAAGGPAPRDPNDHTWDGVKP